MVLQALKLMFCTQKSRSPRALLTIQSYQRSPPTSSLECEHLLEWWAMLGVLGQLDNAPECKFSGKGSASGTTEWGTIFQCFCVNTCAALFISACLTVMPKHAVQSLCRMNVPFPVFNKSGEGLMASGMETQTAHNGTLIIIWCDDMM